MANKKFDIPSDDVDVDVRWKKGSKKNKGKPKENHPRLIMDKDGNYYYAIPFTHSDRKTSKGNAGNTNKYKNYYRLDKDPLGSDKETYAENRVEIKNVSAYGKATKGQLSQRDYKKLNDKVKLAKIKHKKKK